MTSPTRTGRYSLLNSAEAFPSLPAYLHDFVKAEIAIRRRVRDQSLAIEHREISNSGSYASIGAELPTQKWSNESKALVGSSHLGNFDQVDRQSTTRGLD